MDSTKHVTMYALKLCGWRLTSCTDVPNQRALTSYSTSPRPTSRLKSRECTSSDSRGIELSRHEAARCRNRFVGQQMWSVDPSQRSRHPRQLPHTRSYSRDLHLQTPASLKNQTSFAIKMNHLASNETKLYPVPSNFEDG